MNPTRIPWEAVIFQTLLPNITQCITSADSPFSTTSCICFPVSCGALSTNILFLQCPQEGTSSSPCHGKRISEVPQGFALPRAVSGQLFIFPHFSPILEVVSTFLLFTVTSRLLPLYFAVPLESHINDLKFILPPQYSYQMNEKQYSFSF